MKRCLTPEDLEGLVCRRMSARRAHAAREHLADCRKCEAAFDEAQADEAWLKELQEASDLADLRQKVANTIRTCASPADLTKSLGA